MDAMASEATTAGTQQDLRRRIADLERDLGEAQQREAATAELLQVINRPQFALQSVFEAIAQNAMRLCEGEFAFVLRFDGELLRFAASYGLTPEGSTAVQNSLPRPAGDDTANGRAVLNRAVVQIPDVQADPAYGVLGVAKKATYRSLVAVPLLRDGDPIGGITVGRARVGSFSEGQIGLLRTFANQAVIAIENTRLFEEVQARTRELQEALDRQTATSEVLGVISRSPNEAQPVLDMIVATAQRLCKAERAMIWRLQGDTFRVVAHSGQPEERMESILSARMPLSRRSMCGRATLARRAVQVEDVAADAELVAAHAFNRASNTHTVLAVPFLLKGHPIIIETFAAGTQPTPWPGPSPSNIRMDTS
jgi:two-component system, NtrC family, sensor kinase